MREEKSYISEACFKRDKWLITLGQRNNHAFITAEWVYESKHQLFFCDFIGVGDIDMKSCRKCFLLFYIT